jgi:hypothetical protein
VRLATDTATARIRLHHCQTFPTTPRCTLSAAPTRTACTRTPASCWASANKRRHANASDSPAPIASHHTTTTIITSNIFPFYHGACSQKGSWDFGLFQKARRLPYDISTSSRASFHGGSKPQDDTQPSRALLITTRYHFLLFSIDRQSGSETKIKSAHQVADLSKRRNATERKLTLLESIALLSTFCIWIWPEAKEDERHRDQEGHLSSPSPSSASTTSCSLLLEALFLFPLPLPFPILSFSLIGLSRCHSSIPSVECLS